MANKIYISKSVLHCIVHAYGICKTFSKGEERIAQKREDAFWEYQRRNKSILKEREEKEDLSGARKASAF